MNLGEITYIKLLSYVSLNEDKNQKFGYILFEIDNKNEYTINFYQDGEEYFPQIIFHHKIKTKNCQFCNSPLTQERCSYLKNQKDEILNKIINHPEFRFKWITEKYS